MNKIHIALIIGLLIVLAAGGFWYSMNMQPTDMPQQTEEASPAPTGLEASYMNASTDLIVVDLPQPGNVTGKTFSVKGKARGPWYFEASFPVSLLDADGKEIAQGVALADGDWMTEDFVPFSVELTAPQSYIGPATIVLKKDNPSGESQFDASLSIPITVEY